MNAIKRYPLVGDIAILYEGKVRFLGQDATKEFVDTQQCIGVVYEARGRHIKLVSGKPISGSFKYAIACQFEILTIPSTSKVCAVKLSDKPVGDFNYTRADGTLAEFTTQLNTWLATNAPKWEAYEHQGKYYLQLSEYDVYEGSPSITDCTFEKQTGKEQSFVGDWDTPRISNKSGRQYAGICRAKLIDWVRNEKSPNCNPSTRMDGVDNLYVTFPCSELYYNGELGDGLRANYPTYEEYIEACLCRPYDLRGSLRWRDGKEYCRMMYDKTCMVRGVETPMYQAIRAACDFDSGVEGFGKGKWWLPTLQDYAVMMRDVTYGTSNKQVDAINVSLQKKTGWAPLSASVIRWACSRFAFDVAWGCSGGGVSVYWVFRGVYGVVAVSALTLDCNN